MFGPRRPHFEKLETREVFSAGPLASAVQMGADQLAPAEPPLAANGLPYMEQDNVYKLSARQGLLANTYGRGVAVGDVNHDGIPDIAAQSETGVQTVAAAHDAVFSLADDRQGIIAILIGLVRAEKNQDIAVENEETRLAALDLNDLYLFGDWNGDGDVDAADYVAVRRPLDNFIARTTR